MKVRVLVLASLLIGLAGCSSRSDLNPFNWFRPTDQVAIIPEGGFPEDNDQRILVQQVTQLRVELASGGAIIRAVGLPPRQGYWDAELVPVNDEVPENGVVSYRFRIAEPFDATRTGTPYSRQVVVAHFISDFRLRDVRRIQVIGEANSLSARR